MKNFLHNRIAELNNVTWPTQKQAVHSMITVITIMVLVGLLLTFTDAILGELAISVLSS